MMTDPDNGCPPGGANPVDNTMVSFFQQGIAAGRGDSGGPAVIEGPNGILLLIGASSWGGCPRDDFPTIYANVRELSDFITDNITQVAPPCACPSSITHINTNTFFDTDMDMPGDIHVHSGAELLIEATIGMRQGARILVERNARLVIDNQGIVTRGCDAPDWAGIQVLGNNEKAQPERFDPLTDPDQAGIVWIDNATVEWARCGVTAGGGYGEEFWGGLVWTNNTTFSNNRKDVEFMSYKFTTNRSRFFNTTFTEIDDAFANTEGVTIWETDDIEFHNCTFSNMDLEGIRTYDAGVRVLNGCNFEENDMGISSYATYPMSYKIYIGSGTGTENNFVNNRYHVQASLATGWYGVYSNGMFSMDVINNNFSGGEYGVIVEGPSNFRIGGNSFEGVPIGSWAANTGFNNIFNQNLIGCNKYNQGGHSGIFALGENKQMQFLANDFDLSTGGQDFVLAPSFLNFVNGAIRDLQGNPEVPASNCFTDPGNQTDILTWATTDPFTYYYQASEPPLDCDPEPLTPGNYGKIPANPSIFVVDCSQFGGLPEGLPPTPGDLSAKRALLQQLEPQIASDLNAKVQYYQTMAEKETILKYLFAEALENEDYSTAENLLAGEQNKAANWAIFGLRMGRKDFIGAAQLLDQLPIEDNADAQFHDVQLINLQRLQNPTTFQLSTEQENYLTSVAESDSPVRGYARGILGLLKNRRFYPETYEFGGGRNSKPVTTAPDKGALHLYPVPTTNTLFASWPSLPADAEASLQVFDVFGRMRTQKPLNALDTQHIMEVGQLPIGVYLMIISDKGKPVHRTKFIIQR
jgi:hypothetical protein